MTTQIFVMGANDPEMSAIESLLRANQQQVAYAVNADGRRVTPATAYQAAGFVLADNPAQILVAGATHGADVPTLVLIECRVPNIPIECDGHDGQIWPSIVCDHHRPGDPGYGKPADQYWEASSIGQVAAVLDGNHGHDILNGGSSERADELLMVAAADHCLAAAYAGECYGVDPAELADFRIRQRAEFQKREVEELRADMEEALRALRNAPLVFIHPAPDCWDNGSGWCEAHGQHADRCGAIPDLRGRFVPELREAALIARLSGYIAEVKEAGGRRKVVISGDEATVRAFLNSWAKSNGLAEIYGDPIRGFAGGYL